MKRLPLLLAVFAVVAPPAAAATPLDNAVVPSLCEHPAGRLVNGALPGIPENMGSVTLQPETVITGRIRGGAGQERAAVVGCNQGGVGWPENVLLYDDAADPALLATIELYDVTRGGRESVRR